ncbi:hypothetical protein SAMN02745157_1038 [Kaistia soli DSM 19436]|uniref:Uncharacterized protein n=1 Tax=Kaistia soli DSM 19436 TaxID=1122133 RepID=A0A1M4WQ95_9HYPH|nr:hypothetical protein [Kaistia soli]SHE83347.1 hypothetical protein SAMN02745157_1038 [Kaistia soli DSM 19436]
MGDVRSQIFACGTAEPAGIVRRLQSGPLSLDIEGGAVRAVRWQGVEVVRGVICLVRDAHWGTYPAEAASEDTTIEDEAFHYERRFSVADGAADCRFIVAADQPGTLDILAEITARRRLATNRAGLTLLHPIAAVAGAPVTLHHIDGSREDTRFPERIQPAQPAFDIVGIEHVVDGVAVVIDFVGDVFEMEDQRNWTDASFKTYCRPLDLPTPYQLEVGSTLQQRITIRCSGELQPGRPANAAADGLTLGLPGGVLPEVVLALDANEPIAPGTADLIATARVRSIALRLADDIDAGRLAALRPHIGHRDLTIEAVVAEGEDPSSALAGLRQRLDSAGIVAHRVLALPAPYLASHQPSGPWPPGATPHDAAMAARAAFPDAQIGGGMLTSFTEFNRCPPDPSLSDFVSHGTTAIVHAADDRSVMETLEALPAIFQSAAALAPGRPYRLGLISIGMRSNAYGPEREPDPEGRRLAMAKVDPRQRGLFAASFAVGAMSATEGSVVEAMALASATGPFGMIRSAASWPQPYFDDHAEAIVYPLFHVMRALAGLAGLPRCQVGGLPAGIAAVATNTMIVLANLTAEVRELVLPWRANIRLLDTSSFMAAAADPLWLDRPGDTADQITLGAYSVAFLTFTGDHP